MHLNKLSTAALMRLSILAALNLIVGRLLDSWLIVLHPLLFLSIVTIDLGLYAVMVYSGTLNRTLIAMMLAGLAGVLACVAYAGFGVSAFAGYGGGFRGLAGRIEWYVGMATDLLRSWGIPLRAKSWWWRNGIEITYLVIDAIGLGVILAAGHLARTLQSRSGRAGSPAVPPSS